MDASATQTVTSGTSGLNSSAALPSSVAHSPLFKLPRELRDYIYEYSFSNPDLFRVTKDDGIPEPALLSICKLVRDEAIALFNGRERLRLSVKSYDPTVLVLWWLKKTRLARVYGFQPSRLHVNHIGPRSYSSFKQALKFHHAGRIGHLKGGLPGSPEYCEERCFITGLLGVARKMKGIPWKEVETVLDGLRPGLVKMHPDWGL